jgi:Tfp pilus assembly pilus retraction ATPase PilT
MENRVSLQQLLKTQAAQGSSDLHITVGTPPQLRIHGNLCPVKLDPLTAQDTESLCYSILTEEQKRIFEENKELDLSFSVKGVARFRANIFRQKLAVAGVFRLIPHQFVARLSTRYRCNRFWKIDNLGFDDRQNKSRNTRPYSHFGRSCRIFTRS